MLYYNDYLNSENKLETMRRAIENGEVIQGAALYDFLDSLEYGRFDSEDDGIFVTEHYDDFEFRRRWDITKFIIVKFDQKYYCIRKRVGLTEHQKSYCEDQIVERVTEKETTERVWMNYELLKGNKNGNS